MAESTPTTPKRDILEKSSLYQEFLAEREEILRHKWLESEKQQRDIGFERALLDWIRNHRDAWRANRRERVIPVHTDSQSPFRRHFADKEKPRS